MHSEQHNVGELIRAASTAAAGTQGLPPVTVTAGGGLDDAWQYGPWIDRLGFLSCVVAGTAKCALAAAQTAAISLKVQHAADAVGTGAADYTDQYGRSTATKTLSDGADETGELELDVNLLTAKRYIRVGMKANLSAGATDTAAIAALLLLGGAVEVPV